MSKTKVHPLVSLVTHLALEKMGIELGEQRQASTVPELADIPAITNLQHKNGAVILLLGERESGKTILAQRIAEIIGRPTYAVSPEQTPPKWITELKLEQLADRPPPFSTLILDDLPVYMSSRSYTNPLVQVIEQLIPVVRHKRKIILIFSSQTSGQADKWVMDTDLICLKPMGFLYPEIERNTVKKLADKVMPIFREMSERQQKRHCYIFSKSYNGLARIDLPRS